MASKPKRPGPRDVALWRYEQIEELCGEPDRLQRGQLVRARCATPVCWPSGVTAAVSKPTLYRWYASYQAGGLESLQPKPRADRGALRRPIRDEVIDEALRLLAEDPAMTLTLLIAVLEATFSETKLARSTLQRQLAQRPSYKRIQRCRKRGRRRGRFVARAPHDIWHCDAKGPVRVRLISGVELVFHVLSILDDATRAVLAAIVTLSPNLAAAVRVFRAAALRWGLPNRFYADRASIFDSRAFRAALAELGAHRIPTKKRNPEAHGKIEAYHRIIVIWFTDRLPHQQVVDLIHLQQLLDGIVYGLYQQHYHRSIKTSPHEALGGQVSARIVPPTRLYDAFRQQRQLKAHRKTGEVEIDATTYLVADELRGCRLTFLVDPPGQVPPLVVHPVSGEHLSLRRAAVKPQDLPDQRDDEQPLRWGAGPLQTLYDSWSGRRRPIAEPGFGLPELHALLGRVSGRHVPGTDAEAARIQRTYRKHGPWAKAATEAACAAIARQLGAGRPIQTYLDALVARVETNDQPTTD